VYTTPEIPPSTDELALLKETKKTGISAIFEPFREIGHAIGEMPSTLWQLALVYLFQWYAMFVYWQYVSHSIAKSVWHTSASENMPLYEEAAGWTGLVNGFYNIVTFLSAFGLVILAKKYSARYVHAVCLLLAAVALFIMPGIENKYLLFAPMVGFGIAWASMMGIPYIMVANSIPPSKNGVYMGIVNMMIVIPMIIQTLTFGGIYKHYLGSNPSYALYTAGGLLLLASLFTLRVKSDEIEME
jgi:maltose/moltooligosaccharide transporter